MMTRTLNGRLRRLAAVLQPPQRARGPNIRVHLVEPGGEITSTITFEDGAQKWWFAPGHEREPSEENLAHPCADEGR